MINFKLIKKKKLEKLIKNNIALILLKYFKDLRINCSTNILDVQLSNDLLLAKIFVVFINIETKNIKTINNQLNLLNKSTGYISFLLKNYIKYYKIPKLIFKYDNFYQNQQYLFKLIDSLSVSNKNDN